MKIQKVTGTLRDFANTIEIWSNDFFHYSGIIVKIIAVAFSSLLWTLWIYHSLICNFSQIYDWQNALIFLATTIIARSQ